jgi:hypothetical protein
VHTPSAEAKADRFTAQMAQAGIVDCACLEASWSQNGIVLLRLNSFLVIGRS